MDGARMYIENKIGKERREKQLEELRKPLIMTPGFKRKQT